MRSDTARRAAADMVRVLVRAWRTAVRTCRRFAGSFNSGKARSIATISARIFLSVTSAPSRANSRSRSAPSSIVLAIRTPVAAAHRCIRRRCTLQRLSSSTQRCPRDANTRPLRTTPYVQHPMRFQGLSRFGGTLRFTCVRWSACSPQPRLVRRAVAKRSAADRHGRVPLAPGTTQPVTPAPRVRRFGPPSRPRILRLDALVGFLKGAKEPPHHGSKED